MICFMRPIHVHITFTKHMNSSKTPNRASREYAIADEGPTAAQA